MSSENAIATATSASLVGTSWLTRDALRRVLRSLLRAELATNRRQWGIDISQEQDAVPGDGFASEAAPLDGDSLDRLHLAAAVNEMFCLFSADTEDTLLAAPTFGAWLDLVDAGWNRKGSNVTFASSGSTGAPRRTTHARNFLEREIETFARRFADRRRIVAFAPAHHIYGFLFTAMLPSRGDLPVLDASELPPGVLHRELRAGDLLVATPPHWEWLARSLPGFPEGVDGLCSTAPLGASLKQQVLAQGLATLTEIYGSTETAGVGLRTSPEARYTLLPYWTYVTPSEHPADAGPDAARGLVIESAGQQFPLQDHLGMAEDRTFTVGPRVDGAVQVGGTNVYPAHLEGQLRAIPGVAEAAVRLATGPGSQRLHAFIVPAAGAAPRAILAKELKRWADRLPVPQRIASFTFGSALPRDTIGKLTGWPTQ